MTGTFGKQLCSGIRHEASVVGIYSGDSGQGVQSRGTGSQVPPTGGFHRGGSSLKCWSATILGRIECAVGNVKGFHWNHKRVYRFEALRGVMTRKAGSFSKFLEFNVSSA